MIETWSHLPDPPDRKPRGRPVLRTLKAGTTVFRIHRLGRDPVALNWTVRPDRISGGRFDSLDGSYGYVYVGDSAATAIAETLCRDLPLEGAARLVPWTRIAQRALSRLTVAGDLRVLSLRGPALTQVGAPLALTKCGADAYETTRAWALALRRWVPRAQGFAYRPRHDEDGLTWVAFEEALVASDDPVPLTEPGMLRVVRDVLHAHNATFE